MDIVNIKPREMTFFIEEKYAGQSVSFMTEFQRNMKLIRNRWALEFCHYLPFKISATGGILTYGRRHEHYLSQHAFCCFQTMITVICVTVIDSLFSNAHAYLDPGSGSYFMQILLASLFAGLFAIKGLWKKIVNGVHLLIHRQKVNHPDEE